MNKFTRFPKHIAIVPDGNGRWAERQGLPRLHGHRAGAENMSNMVQYLSEYPVRYVTLYGFSTENWNRPNDEVRGLFHILSEFIDREIPMLTERNIQLRHLGRIEELPQELCQKITDAVKYTSSNSGMVLSLAFNYGGRAEIIDAVRKMISDGIKANEVDEKLFGNYLYTAGLADVDLLIRTGDEVRLSNFLIWQTVYGEYYFTETLWPDFSKEEADKALLAFSQRTRRFGGL
jgi:undecaprenyl diphosphate synthase